MAAGKADEEAGLAPSEEENEAGSNFSPEKPCLPLSIDGIMFSLLRGNRQFQIRIRL